MCLAPGEPINCENVFVFTTAVSNILFTDYLVHKRFVGNLFVRAVKGCALSSFATVLAVSAYAAAATHAWPKLLFLPLAGVKILVTVFLAAIVPFFLVELFFVFLLEGTKKAGHENEKHI